LRLSRFEQDLFISIAAALAGAKADECLRDGVGTAHRIQDAAMVQVREWRTKIKADRMRQRARRKRRNAGSRGKA
jgi:hypothetical protein